jgi:large subunit ribosomal protein L21
MTSAIIRTGGQQYVVSAGTKLTVDRVAGDVGSTVTLDTLVANGKIGAPLLDAGVQATIVEHTRADKVIIFKKKRRQNYRRKNGHRQDQSVLEITKIA